MFNDQRSWVIAHLIWLLFVVNGILAKDFNSSFSPEHINHLRNETKQLFNHAWTSYMNHGFPYDEVRPITCKSYGPDYKNVYNIIRNDAMGNTSLTVVDNLDTLIIMEEWDQLEHMLDFLNYNKETIFVKNTVVQVFESTIRSLGGLLSAHLLLTDVAKNKSVPEKYKRLKQITDQYDGFLLDLAYDLGLRLIPAFQTSNNIPYPRINLAKGLKGVPTKLQSENCLSGATTPVLEMTLLSKLTGDPQFEYYTQATYWKLWISRLTLDLLPMTISPDRNKWLDSITGIGASVDSFYEYSAKSYILFDDPYMWSVFKSSYKALLTHLVIGGGPNEGSMIFSNIGVYDGNIMTNWIDLLGAFWPGVQVLTGQLTDAVKTHLVYLKIWDSFDLIPERWVHYVDGDKILDANGAIALEWYPLRPEFIESTYYLYRATRDPMYLQVGERILNLFKTKFRANCGFSGFQDIRTGKMQNRMETFVMGETLKYLYLLFDAHDEVFLHSDLMKNKNWIFSTEAHPLWYNKHLEFKQPMGPVGPPETKEESRWLKTLIKTREISSVFYNTYPTFYRNVSNPQVNLEDIPGNSDKRIHKQDPYAARFDTCEVSLKVPPLTNSFMLSYYYLWDQTFQPDYVYRRTLAKPSHSSQSSLDGSCIELTPQFYEKYTMFQPVPGQLYLQCPRPATATQYDLILGESNNFNAAEISQLTVINNSHQFSPNRTDAPSANDVHDNVTDDSSAKNALKATDNSSVYSTPIRTIQEFPRTGDLWVPHLEGLRVRFEVLTEGDIDTTNTKITQQYLELFLPDVSAVADDVHMHTTIPLQVLASPASILRLIKINGLEVDQGSVIWTLPFDPVTTQDSNIPVMYFDEYNRVVLDGSIIENLVVWGG